ncbi:MAG: carbohydrate kinase, partial [Halobacteria archaeon]|nr:carbohydrate kinase [Halobacteria archaeon]
MTPSKLDPGNSPMFIGIDLGTSGIRAILIDAAEHIIAEARADLPQPMRQGNTIEQDPHIWWQGLIDVMHRLGGKTSLDSVRALAVDSTSSTLLLADKTGHPLHASLMYNDSRAQNQLPKLKQLAPADSPVHSSSSGLAKLLWLSEQPFARQAHYALHQADWIAGKLAGRFGFSDPNNALKTGYDAEQGCWPEWLEQLPRLRNWLPTVYPQATAVCGIDPGMAEGFGLPPQAQIITGT